MTDATTPGAGTTGGNASVTVPDPGGVAPSYDGKRPFDKGKLVRALLFLLPALLILAVLVVYPIFATIVRSLYDRSGDTFIGLDNYFEIWQNDGTRTALKNNLIWVVFAPTIATALGLVFAVLAERIRWQTAFKLAVFMPMAISFLAAGVIFRLVYDSDPDKGVANAIVTTVAKPFKEDGDYVGARAIEQDDFRQDVVMTTDAKYNAGDIVNLGFVGVPPANLPSEAKAVQVPGSTAGSLGGVVWLDFAAGGGGQSGVPEANEKGMPHVKVHVLDSTGKEVGSDTTNDVGQWKVTDLSGTGPYSVRIGEGAFQAAWQGVNWLGKSLVTASVISAFIWIWAGFAMIVIGSGLAAIPRDVLEAARVDGATEWQVFRRVTVPLLMPVLTVVLVTLVINVLKVFDLVFIIPPGSVQADATVIALEMWRVSFGGSQDQGLGSAISVVLFLLVIPAMAVNIKRFRSGN